MLKASHGCPAQTRAIPRIVRICDQSTRASRGLVATCADSSSASSAPVRAAKASPGRPQRFAETVVAARRLPSDARSRGPVAKLTAFAVAHSVQTVATSQWLKRAARAGRGPCASRRLRGALRPARARLCGSTGGLRREHPCCCLAAGGTRRRRFLWRREAQAWGRRAQRASTTISSRLSERSERSERSEFRDATPGRASQWSRRVAPTATA